jgi:hypothetical protein
MPNMVINNAMPDTCAVCKQAYVNHAHPDPARRGSIMSRTCGCPVFTSTVGNGNSVTIIGDPRVEMNSTRSIQRQLRERGEFDVADALNEFKWLQDDLEYQLAYYRLVREFGYAIPFLWEDAEGMFMIAFQKLQPHEQEAELTRLRRPRLPATTNEEKLQQFLQDLQESPPVPLGS